MPHELNGELTRSPVLFLVFNRPKQTARVFEAIRAVRPPRLYVGADGPRPDREGEAILCEEVRCIATQVDWLCEVKTLFREKNLGCKHAVSSAITWFFENEEEGIVLEDDCLPSASFFKFADQMLELYRDDERIFLVSGYNRQSTWKCDKNDYFFSNYGGIWGWASWRRAWQHFDLEMEDLEQFIEQGLLEYLLGVRQGRVRRAQFIRTKQKNLDAWDYQWGFARHKNTGLACVPCKSLIQNIGFGVDATHTTGIDRDNVVRYEMDFPLRENPFLIPDRAYDERFHPQPRFFKIILLSVRPGLKAVLRLINP